MTDVQLLLSRIHERLKENDVTPKQAGRESGVGEDYIRNIERGNTKSPKAADLIALADYLDTTMMYLVGLTDDPSPALLRGGGAGRLMVRRTLRAGVWMDGRAASETESPSDLAVSMHYPIDAQWAEIVGDDSLYDIGVHAGSVLHCVNTDAFEYEPAPGDIVSVRRLRMEGMEERTARIIERDGQGLSAVTHPADVQRADKAPLTPEGSGEIEAVVIAVWRRTYGN